LGWQRFFIPSSSGGLQQLKLPKPSFEAEIEGKAANLIVKNITKIVH